MQHRTGNVVERVTKLLGVLTGSYAVAKTHWAREEVLTQRLQVFEEVPPGLEDEWASGQVCAKQIFSWVRQEESPCEEGGAPDIYDEFLQFFAGPWTGLGFGAKSNLSFYMGLKAGCQGFVLCPLFLLVFAARFNRAELHDAVLFEHVKHVVLRSFLGSIKCSVCYPLPPAGCGDCGAGAAFLLLHIVRQRLCLCAAQQLSRCPHSQRSARALAANIGLREEAVKRRRPPSRWQKQAEAT